MTATAAPGVAPAAAGGAAGGASGGPTFQQEEGQDEHRLDHVPRGPLPTSLLVLAEALDGSLCPLISDLAQQLVQQLLLLHEEHPCLFPTARGPLGGPSGGSQTSPLFSLEVEGRLGVIRERDSGARLQLPLATHAVLQPSFCAQVGGLPEGDGGPQARFVAGVSAAQFNELKGLLLSLTARNPRVAEQRLQVHLALMGIEPCGAPLEALSDESEENGGPLSAADLQKEVQWHLTGDDWTIMPERETEENYFHIPALQAAARFSSRRGPSLPGGAGNIRAPPPRGGYLLGAGDPGGASVSVQSLGQVLDTPGIYKKSLLQWNVYTGADKDEAFRPTDDLGAPSDGAEETAERTRVDYRLAINFEHRIEVKELQKSLMQGASQGAPVGRGGYGSVGVPSTEPNFRRFRLRQSLVHRSGLRIDLTKVQQQMKPTWGRQEGNRRENQGRWLHEVEIELHPTQIAKAILHKQQTGDPRPLWCLCITFLSLLRELAAPLNSPMAARGNGQGGPNTKGMGPSSEEEWADLGDVQATESEKAIFKHFLVDRLPLIGDYAYRAVASRFQEESTTGEEVIPSLEEFMKEPDVEKKCLYTHNRTEVPGPWIPHRDAEGRVHLVELKR